MNRFCLLAIGIFFLFGCSKRASKTVYSDDLEFNYFAGKAKVDLDDGSTKVSLNANIRIKHDSIIWISAQHPLMKIGKCLVTKDSVFILKDFQASEYYRYSFAELSQKMGYNLNYTIIEDVLMGNMPKIDNKPKYMEYEGNKIITQQMNEMKIVSKVNAETKKVISLDIAQNGTKNQVLMDYNQFENINGKTFATENVIKTNLQLKPENLLDAIFKLKYNKPIFTDEVQSFPFAVNNKYEYKN